MPDRAEAEKRQLIMDEARARRPAEGDRAARVRGDGTGRVVARRGFVDLEGFLEVGVQGHGWSGYEGGREGTPRARTAHAI